MLHWALLLPLAMPTYIVAFAYLDLLHPIGPVQGAIRWALGFDSPRQFRLPDLRSMPGAIFVLGFVLYPYVYMTRARHVHDAAGAPDGGGAHAGREPRAAPSSAWRCRWRGPRWRWA